MRTVSRVMWLSCLSLITAVPALAQVPARPRAATDSLSMSVARLSARLDSLVAGQCPGGSLVLPALPADRGPADSLAAAVRTLAARVQDLTAQRCPAVAGTPTPGDHADPLAAVRAAAAAAAGGEAAVGDTAGAPVTVPPPPNQNVLNPEISATGDVRLVLREGRQEDNALAREFELSLQSALDPYSKTKIFLSFSDEGVEVEEGYVYWNGLPGRVRADLGKFRQEVGDLNRWHSHALPESEYPLVYRRFMGDEGLAGVGLSLYTVLPFGLAGGTHEAWLQGTVSESEPLVAGGRQPMVLGRLKNFWQLSRSSYIQVGATGTAGENSDSAFTSNLLGLDFRFTWRPPHAGTRQNLTLRAEGYRLQVRQAGLFNNRYGGFAQASYQAGRRWVLGARYDYVDGVPGGEAEWEIVPSLTWWQSEFVYLRLEGERARRDGFDARNMLSLQVVWAMGPHKHETY